MSDPIRPDEVIPPEGKGSVQVRQMAKDFLFLLPNLVKLLWRLVQDPRVPRRSKLALVLAGVYVISPIDLLPDFIVGAGQLDDIFVVALAINHLIQRAGEDVVRQHWDGPQDLLKVIRGVLDTTTDLVPARLRKLFGQVSGA
jgi:uncharacterized membrane protein YkvA (DUF1232 family)